MTSALADLLVPRPARFESRPGSLRLRAGEALTVAGPADGRPTRQLERALASTRLELREASDEAALVRFAIERVDAPPAEGYRLAVSPRGVQVEAADEQGLFYGACTVAQLLAARTNDGAPTELPCLEIEDAPDFPARGVMLDVSRDRVPTMQTLFGIVEQLARWKVNRLQLYMEHTFAYVGHEAVWNGASPFTPDEIRALDDFCHERFVELVPNQQSLGHFHRWLRHDRYRPLAECPEGVEHPFSIEAEPFSLCPTDPRTRELLADLFDQLLPAFRSEWANAGLDETFDVGRGRSREASAAAGPGRIYLEHLKAVHRLLADRGRRLEFWGDVILEHPELVPELPRDAVALAWGYEDGHPFAESGRRFADSGLAFHVCPGTSSWQSVGGRIENARANLAQAALQGLECGASGVLVTDWGDFGHWQPLPVSWPGWLVGAAHAWNARAPVANLSELLNEHVFHDPSGATGAALTALGQVARDCSTRTENGSALFFLLRFAHEGLPHPRVPGLDGSGLERAVARLDEVHGHLARGRAAGSDGELVAGEIRWASELLTFAAGLGRARLAAPAGAPLGSLPGAERARLGGELRDLTKRYRRLWTARSRPGGLADSVARMERLLPLLESPS